VEVTGEHVQDVDEPARDGAELLLARAHAAIHRRRLGPGATARDAADDAGRDPADRRNSLGREVPGETLDLLQADGVRGEAAGPDQPLVAERVHEGEEEQRVGPRTDEVM